MNMILTGDVHYNINKQDSYENKQTSKHDVIKNVVSVEELKSLEVPLPSSEIQQEIVEQCDEEINYIKMTEKFIEKQKEKIDLILKDIWSENKDQLQDENIVQA